MLAVTSTLMLTSALTSMLTSALTSPFVLAVMLAVTSTLTLRAAPTSLLVLAVTLAVMSMLMMRPGHGLLGPGRFPMLVPVYTSAFPGDWKMLGQGYRSRFMVSRIIGYACSVCVCVCVCVCV